MDIRAVRVKEGMQRLRRNPTEVEKSTALLRLYKSLEEVDSGIFLHPHDVFYLTTGELSQFERPKRPFSHLDGEYVIQGAILVPVRYISGFFEDLSDWDEIVLMSVLFDPDVYMISEDAKTKIGILHNISVRSVIMQGFGVRPHGFIEASLRNMTIRQNGKKLDVYAYCIPAPLVVTNPVSIQGIEENNLISFGRINIERPDGAIVGEDLVNLIIDGHVDKDLFDPTGRDPEKITFAYDPSGRSIAGLVIPIAKYFAFNSQTLNFKEVAELSSKERDRMDNMFGLGEVEAPLINSRWSLQETIPVSVPHGYIWKISGQEIRGDRIFGKNFIMDLNASSYHLPSDIIDGGWEGPIRTEVKRLPNPLPKAFNNIKIQKERINKYIVIKVFANPFPFKGS